MTKREAAQVRKRRGERYAIVRGLEEAARLGFTKPDDLAGFVQTALAEHQELVAATRAFLNHRAADPHCTCNDCLSYTEGTHPTQRGERP